MTMIELDLGMDNFDNEHPIDEGFEAALRERPNEVFGRHSGTEFNGIVYFDGEDFVEKVYVFHNLRDTIEADTLEQLRDYVNNQYGDY
jgi:hypothetical protein